MTKMQKLKEWTKAHTEDIFVGTVLTAAAAGFVALIVVAVKDENARLEQEQKSINEYNQWVEDVNNWIVDEANSGNNVYALSPNKYVVIPQDAPQTLVIK